MLASRAAAPARVQVMAALSTAARGQRGRAANFQSSAGAGLTGWEPTVPLREGLRRAIDWVAANLSRYRADQYLI